MDFKLNSVKQMKSNLTEQLKSPSETPVHATLFAELVIVGWETQALLPTPEPQQVSRLHVSQHNLLENVIQSSVAVRHDENLLARVVMI